MPPALSEDENDVSSDEAEPITIRTKGKSKSNTPAKHDPVIEVSDGEGEGQGEGQGEEEEDDEDEEGGESDEYVVEKILSHKTTQEGNMYRVKWLGYEAKKDLTWEPEENLASAEDILHAYWATIGGRPEPQSKKRKGRKSAAAADEEELDTPLVKTAKRAKQEWAPPPGSWEHDVDLVETVEESLDPKTGKMRRYGYLLWKNGMKTQHPLEHLYGKCPQKMLQYYEQHLVFRHEDQDPQQNGS